MSTPNPPRKQKKISHSTPLTGWPFTLILPPYPLALRAGKTLAMFKFLTSVKTIASNLVRPLFGRQGDTIPVDGKAVETSRYCHITSPLTHARWYISKPATAGCGYSVRVSEVKAGDKWLTVQVVNNFTGKTEFETRVLTVEDGKAIAATLASACMKAQPKTGRKMEADNWCEQADAARIAKMDADQQMSLFA